MKNLKAFLLVVLCMIPFMNFAQGNDFYLNNGYLAGGYDVVSYFGGKPQEGSKKLTHEYSKGVKLKFISEANLNKFKSEPDKYLPAYGGWCAYAMAKNQLASVDPETYEIRDGQLLLFYNKFFTNTFDKWKEEGAVKLKKEADGNWEKHQFEN